MKEKERSGCVATSLTEENITSIEKNMSEKNCFTFKNNEASMHSFQ
jgi:hypothetical protein